MPPNLPLELVRASLALAGLDPAAPVEAPARASPALPVPELVAIVVLSLAVTAVMVRFSALMVTPRRPAAGEPVRPRGLAPVHAWGLAYLVLWAALAAALLRFVALMGEPLTGRTVGLLLFVALAWFGFNAGWIALARALLRANARSAGLADPFTPGGIAGLPAAAGRSEPWASPAEGHAGEPEAGRWTEEAGEGVGSTEAAAAAGREAPAPRPRWKRALSTAAWGAGAILVLAAGEALPPLQDLAGFMTLHRAWFLGPAIAAAALGFVLLVGGGVAMALASGQPMSRREIEQMERLRREAAAGPAVARVSAYKSWGPAVGAQGSDEVSFREMKLAWRGRAWRASRRWRRLFAMTAGGALLFFGLFGVCFVLAPAGLKLLIGLAVVYAVVQTARGFSRA